MKKSVVKSFFAVCIICVYCAQMIQPAFASIVTTAQIVPHQDTVSSDGVGGGITKQVQSYAWPMALFVETHQPSVAYRGYQKPSVASEEKVFEDVHGDWTYADGKSVKRINTIEASQETLDTLWGADFVDAIDAAFEEHEQDKKTIDGDTVAEVAKRIKEQLPDLARGLGVDEDRIDEIMNEKIAEATQQVSEDFDGDSGRLGYERFMWHVIALAAKRGTDGVGIPVVKENVLEVVKNFSITETFQESAQIPDKKKIVQRLDTLQAQFPMQSFSKKMPKDEVGSYVGIYFQNKLLVETVVPLLAELRLYDLLLITVREIRLNDAFLYELYKNIANGTFGSLSAHEGWVQGLFENLLLYHQTFAIQMTEHLNDVLPILENEGETYAVTKTCVYDLISELSTYSHDAYTFYKEYGTTFAPHEDKLNSVRSMMASGALVYADQVVVILTARGEKTRLKEFYRERLHRLKGVCYGADGVTNKKEYWKRYGEFLKKYMHLYLPLMTNGASAVDTPDAEEYAFAVRAYSEYLVEMAHVTRGKEMYFELFSGIEFVSRAATFIDDPTVLDPVRVLVDAKEDGSAFNAVIEEGLHQIEAWHQDYLRQLYGVLEIDDLNEKKQRKQVKTIYRLYEDLYSVFAPLYEGLREIRDVMEYASDSALSEMYLEMFDKLEADLDAKNIDDVMAGFLAQVRQCLSGGRVKSALTIAHEFFEVFSLEYAVYEEVLKPLRMVVDCVEGNQYSSGNLLLKSIQEKLRARSYARRNWRTVLAAPMRQRVLQDSIAAGRYEHVKVGGIHDFSEALLILYRDVVQAITLFRNDDSDGATVCLSHAAEVIRRGTELLTTYKEGDARTNRDDQEMWYDSYWNEFNRLTSMVMYLNWVLEKKNAEELEKLYVLSQAHLTSDTTSIEKPKSVLAESLSSIEQHLIQGTEALEEGAYKDVFLLLAGLHDMPIYDVTGWLLQYFNQVLTYGVTYENASLAVWRPDLLSDVQAKCVARALCRLLTLEQKELVALVEHYGITDGELRRVDMRAFALQVKTLLYQDDIILDERFAVVIFRQFLELLERKDVTAEKVAALLDIVSMTDEFDKFIAMRTFGYRMSKNADQKVLRKLESYVTRTASTVQQEFQRVSQLVSRFEFLEARTVLESMEDALFDPPLCESALFVYKRLEAAWKKYSMGEFDAALDLVEEVLASTPPFMNGEHPAQKMKTYIVRVMKAENLVKQGFFVEAQGEFDKSKKYDGVVDPYSEQLKREISNLESGIHEAERAIAEGRLAEAETVLRGFHARGYYGEQIYTLLWSLARAFFDRAEQTKVFLHVDRLRDFQFAEDVAILVEDALEKNSAAFSAVKEKNKSVQQRGGKKKQAVPQRHVKQPKQAVDRSDVATLRTRARVYAVREKLRLDEKMLEKVVLAEQALIRDLGESVDAQGEATVLPRVKLYYHWLLRSDEYEHSCKVSGVASLKSQNAIFDLERGNFQVGDFFAFYADPEAKQPIANALFEVVGIEKESLQLRLQNAGRKTEEEVEAIFHQLPNSGKFERIPHSSELKQWRLVRELLQSLEKHVDSDLPTTGDALIDQTLGLFVPSNAVPQSLILGPAGAGKTTGVILSALRKWFDARHGEGTYCIGVHEGQLDVMQRAAVQRMSDSVAVVSTRGPLKIRITAKTNDAVDVIGAQLKKAGVPFIRLGNQEDSINDDVRDVWQERQRLINDAEIAYTERGESIIVLSTVDSLTSDIHYRESPFFNPEKKTESFYDITIVDEAPMLTWMETLLAHLDTKAIACIGDWTQLRSLGITDGQIKTIKRLVGDTAQIRGLFNPVNREQYSISLFEMLYKRPHEGICREQLEVLRRFTRYLADTVVKRLYERYGIEVHGDAKTAMQPSVGAVSVTPTEGPEGCVEFSRGAESYCNISEVEAVLKKVDALLNRSDEQGGKIHFSDITIITYYNAQVKLLNAAFRVKTILNEYARSRPERIDVRILDRLDLDLTRIKVAYEATAKTLRDDYDAKENDKERALDAINSNHTQESRRVGLRKKVHFLNKQLGFLRHSENAYAKSAEQVTLCLDVVKSVKNGNGSLSEISQYMPMKGMRVKQNWSFPSYAQLSKHPFFISSVDGAQGAENSCVLLSFVRNNTRNDIGFLRNWNRLLVSLSRMKKELHMVGSFERTLTKTQFRMRPAEYYVQNPRQREEHVRIKEEVDQARELFQFLNEMPAKVASDRALFDGEMPQRDGYYGNDEGDAYADSAWRSALSFFGAVWTRRVGSAAYDAFVSESKKPEIDMMSFVLRYMIPCMSFSVGITPNDVSSEFKSGLEAVLSSDFDYEWMSRVVAMRSQPDVDVMRIGFEKMLAVESLPPHARDLITALSAQSNRDLVKWWEETAPLLRVLLELKYDMAVFAEDHGDVLPAAFMDAGEMEALFMSLRRERGEAFVGDTVLKSA